MEMINDFVKQGYKYLFVPKRCTTTFYLTKNEISELSDDSEFHEYKAEGDYEKAVLKVFDKNTFIKLCA